MSHLVPLVLRLFRSPWAWGGPAGAVWLLYFASGPGMGWFVDKYAWTGKDLQELVGPTLLALATALALYFWHQQRQPALGWVAALAPILLVREFHLPGTTGGVYVALAAWAISGWRQRDAWRLAALPPALGSVWLGVAATYALALGLDGGLDDLLPHARLWSVNAEETLESWGHLQILAGACLAGLHPARTGLTFRSCEWILRRNFESVQLPT